jgi:hypothetical protein
MGDYPGRIRAAARLLVAEGQAAGQQDIATDNMQGLEFRRVVDNPATAAATKLILSMGVLVLVSTLGLWLAGLVEGRLLQAVLFTSALFPVMAWSIRSMQGGTIEVRPDYLQIRSPGTTARYRWEHIAEFRVATLADTGKWARWMAGLTGTDATHPIVLMRLRKSAHFNVGLFKNELDTRDIGIPTGARVIPLFVESPETVVELATPYLEAARKAVPLS